MPYDQLFDGCGVNIDHLSFSYPGRPLFSRFSLKTARRRIVLKGPSGCGKTTLLKLLFGSLPHNPEAVLPEISNPVMVLQEDALFPWLTGRANIQRFLSVSPEILEQHPLFPVVSSFFERPAYQMSYGQRRSIELFRAMLQKSKAIFLDEPFNYLDDTKAVAFIDHLVSPEWHSVLQIITTHRHDSSLDAASEVFLFEGEPPFGKLMQQP